MWAPPMTVKTVDTHYVRRLDAVVGDSLCPRLLSDILLFPTPYVRWLGAVGHKPMPLDIVYVRRFEAYVRRLWPSKVLCFTVVNL
jgi:hypothetical protein